MRRVVQLPEPYPDEALYSLLGRAFHPATGIPNEVLWRQVLGRRQCRPLDPVPSWLSALAEALATPVEPLRLASAFTVFPYFARFLAPAALEAACEALRLGAEALPVLRRYRGHVAPVRRLKACSDCMVEDRTRHGEAYWRLSHQLPGVLVCPVHGCALDEARMARYGREAFRFKSPTECSLVQRDGPSGLASVWLASASVRQLKSPPLMDKAGFLFSEYVRRTPGSDGDDARAATRLASVFATELDPGFWRASACNRELFTSARWLVQVLRREVPLHPFGHLLIQYALGFEPKELEEHVLEAGMGRGRDSNFRGRARTEDEYPGRSGPCDAG